MPTVKFPVVLTACETCREMQHVLETLTRVSYIKATEGWCQVKKSMSVPSLDQTNPWFHRRRLKTWGEKKKTKQTKNNKIQFFLRKKLDSFRMVLTENLDILLSK